MEAKKVPQHENLTGTNNLVVRQNRFISEGTFQAEISGQKFNILNYSLFGLGLQSEMEFQEGKFLENVTISCGSQQITTLAFVVKRVKKADFGYEVGLETVNTTVPVETIMRIKDFNAVVSGLDEKQNHYEILPQAFKLAVLDLSVRFEAYEKYVKTFSEKEFSNSLEYHEAKDSLVEVVAAQLKTEITNYAAKMKSSFDHTKTELFKPAFAYFREGVGKYLFQSPFTKRSFEKPRGYAGDYIMMKQIYANDSFANSLFGSCMERAIQNHPEPGAVRNRSTYLANKIVDTVRNTKGPIKFLSVACGPAEEVRKALEILPQAELDRCEFNLLDQDEGALQFAQKTILETAIAKNKKITLKLVNKGIKEVLVMGLDKNYDVIYSAGLFDYFTDVVAMKAGRMLFKHLNAGGQLIIGNFNIETTNWFSMLALFDWSLILRNEADFKRLFTMNTGTLKIESEDNNVNLFCCIKN